LTTSFGGNQFSCGDETFFVRQSDGLARAYGFVGRLEAGHAHDRADNEVNLGVGCDANGTRRAMNDEIDFAEALGQRVALLKGLPESALDEAAARIRLVSGARALVATMRAHGAYAVLVSGGFTRYTSRIRAALGFDRDIANELVIENGRLAGTVREPILAREAKLEALKTIAAERGLPLFATLAVGDGANDMAMIDAAGLGIAFHAKPAVAARARHRIDHGDLTALLYAQGYRALEIVGLD